MALEWKEKVDGKDDVLAEDINALASVIKENETKINEINEDIKNNEKLTNKSTVIDKTANDDQYPTTNAVKKYVDGLEKNVASALNRKADSDSVERLREMLLYTEELENKVQVIDDTVDHTTYPSARAVKDYAESNFANILKGYATGCPLVLTDVSPIEHEILATENAGVTEIVRCGKNFFDYKAFVKYCNGNGGSGATETVEYLGEECFSYKVLPRDGSLRFIMDGIQENTQYTLTMEYAISRYNDNESYAMSVLYIYYTDGTHDKILPTAYATKFIKYTHTTKAGKTVLGFRIPGFDSGATVYVKKNMQFELGTDSTEAEPYVEPIHYDHYDAEEVLKIPSLYPTTVLYEPGGGDVIAEYNRDINRVIANLENAILSLGGNV